MPRRRADGYSENSMKKHDVDCECMQTAPAAAAVVLWTPMSTMNYHVNKIC